MKFENHQFYNCTVDLDNGEQYNISANWLHNNNLDYWKGWECEAGQSRLLINFDQGIYGGECLNDYLGNLETGWEYENKPTVCKRDRCFSCTDDLLVGKRLK